MSNDNILYVVKVHCPVCRRFMLKYVEDENSNFMSFTKCINCKNTCCIYVENGVAKYGLEKKEFDIEPGSVIKKEEIEQIKKNMKAD